MQTMEAATAAARTCRTWLTQSRYDCGGPRAREDDITPSTMYVVTSLRTTGLSATTVAIASGGYDASLRSGMRPAFPERCHQQEQVDALAQFDSTRCGEDRGAAYQGPCVVPQVELAVKLARALVKASHRFGEGSKRGR